ncbi:ABC transporter substrate-binding protein [Arboricoccus pini]|nr:ABC transporter substrate-binding protein [Arboricoccus pini]
MSALVRLGTGPLSRGSRAICLGVALLVTGSGLLRAQTPPSSDTAPAASPTKPGQVKLSIEIVYFSREERPVEYLSLAEPVLTDAGLRGVEQGIRDDQTTGRFLGHAYAMSTIKVPANGDIAAAFKAALDKGQRFFVADLKKDDLLTIAPLADAAGAIVFNARAPDDDLRTDICHISVFHTALSYAQKADALAQYLVWKRWTRWFLLVGSHPEDKAFGTALRRSATKFGINIVEDRTYEDTGGARRTDTGAVQVQRQMPIVTQNAATHDVVVVADESEVFGDYVPYRTWDPRPVVGTSGLVPTAWSRVTEQWGGTQMQRRFEKTAGRPMNERDYDAWVATRALGEAVTRTGSADPATLHAYLASDKLEVGAFKGQGLSFRAWDQQIREPILLVTSRTLVSVSPQDEFLHQRSTLDTMGFDEPESRCRLNGPG